MAGTAGTTAGTVANGVANGKRLLMFTGTECTHCHEMLPLVEQLEKELGVKVEKLEVWHNSSNMAQGFEELYSSFDYSSGVPVALAHLTNLSLTSRDAYMRITAFEGNKQKAPRLFITFTVP